MTEEGVGWVVYAVIVHAGMPLAQISLVWLLLPIVITARGGDQLHIGDTFLCRDCY